MKWANEYIDIPFIDLGRTHAGSDCYGLIRLVLMEQCDIVLPSYTEVYSDTEEYDKMKAHISLVAERDWVQVIPAQVQPFDVIIMNIIGQPVHLGIVVKKGWMLHIEEGKQAITEEYTKGVWRNPGKVVGFYRHKDLCKQT